MKNTFFLFLVSMLHTSLMQAQNVGIGTNTPATTLHVKSTLNEAIRVQAPLGYMTFYDDINYRGYVQAYSGGLSIGTSFGNDLRFYTNGGLERMSILANGNVGILKSNPSYALDISGDMNFTGLLRIAGSSGTTGKVVTSNGVSSSPAWVSPTNSIYSTARFFSLQSNQILHDGNLVDLPGLSYTFTLNENTVIQISDNLYYLTTGCALCSENFVFNNIVIDGTTYTSFLTQGDNKKLNSGGTVLAQLGPGTHTIKVTASNNVSAGDVTVFGVFGNINYSNLSLLFFPQ